MRFTLDRLLRLIILVLGVLVIGAIGYMIIEGWSLTDALYMTTITLSTVGFGEVKALSPSGRLFTIFLIFVGVGVIIYGFGFIAEYILSINMVEEFRKRRSLTMIRKLEEHIIICGYGRVGKSAATSLRESSKQVVIIDSDPAVVQQAIEDGFLALEGDASNDDVLLEAEIQKAWGIIITTGEDSLNLFIVLSAKSINSKLFTVARANQSSSEIKFQRAGADRVVSPHHIGGQHMANIMIRPHVTDFFDVVTLKGGEELWIEELIISAGCPLEGQTVGEADIRRRTGVTLVALHRQNLDANIVPDANTQLHTGDELIVLGTKKQLGDLEALIRPADSNSNV